MKGFFKELQQEGVGFWSFWLTATLCVIVLGGILILFRSLPPYIPLYNHLPWGYARLGHSYEIFVPFLTVICVTIANTMIALKLRSNYPLLSRFLFAANFALAFFMLIFYLKLAQIIL